MRIVIIIIGILMFNTKVNACVCNRPPLTTESLAKYKYIALVKIIRLKPISFKTDTYPNEHDEAEIQILENFKGNLTNKILVNSVRSSCDMGVKENDTWIVFANDFNGYPQIQPCSYNKQFTSKYHTPFWGINNYDKDCIETLNFLRSMFGKFPLNGTYKAKFLNGRPAYTLQFKNGKLDGEQLMYDGDGNKIISEYYKDSLRNGNTLIWYDSRKLRTKCYYINNQLNGNYLQWHYNGRKSIESEFVNGKKINTTTNWDENGDTIFIGKYKNDFLIDTCKSWFLIDTSLRNAKGDIFNLERAPADTILKWNCTRQVKKMSIYDSLGRLLHSIEYFRNGSIYSVIDFEPNSKLYFEHTYHFNRVTQSFEIFWMINDSAHWNHRDKRRIYLERCFDDRNEKIYKSFFDKQGIIFKSVEIENGKETVVFDKSDKK